MIRTLVLLLLAGTAPVLAQSSADWRVIGGTQAPGDAPLVYRLNRLTGGVVLCVAGNKDDSTGCE